MTVLPMLSTADTLRQRRVDAHLLLTLNRPHKLNALDGATIDRLQDVLDEAEANDAIRTVILTGAGDRAFSAGADLSELAKIVRDGGTDAAVRLFLRRGQTLTRRIENFPKPVIVAVNGLAWGAGCEITEAAPLAVASERASFGKPEIARGFPPPFGGTQRLSRHIGRKRAIEMILTGEPIDAARAFEMGLVNRVVPHGRLIDEALALASRIAEWPREVVAACLASVTRGINLPIDEGLAIEATNFARALDRPDGFEGIERFANRKKTEASSVPVG